MGTLPDLKELFAGKNLLIFDLETTGFSTEKELFGTYRYKCYQDNNNYKNARVIEVGWKYIEKWDGCFDTEDDEVRACYVNAPDIKRITNTHIHGITLKCIKSKGKLFKKILDKHGFGYALEHTDYIIAHNAKFDVPILLNELHRLKYNRKINKVLALLEKDKIICTLKYGKAICVGSYNLSSFYQHYYIKMPKNTHTADGDVKILLCVLDGIVSDPMFNKIEQEEGLEEGLDEELEEGLDEELEEGLDEELELEEEYI